MKTSEAIPKLLLIAGYFPPVRISSGSIRAWNLARYLTELGWEVTIVTPKISVWDSKNLDNVENVKAEIQEIGIKMVYTNHLLTCLAPWRYMPSNNKILWFFGGILRRMTRFLGIQNWVGWVPSALHACRHLKNDDVDVILASGAPFWGFEIAYRLSKRLKKPFVMDYRDLWTDNPFSPENHKWISKLENKLVEHSSAITVVSPISGMILGQKYNTERKIFAITNGYDQDEIRMIEPIELDPFAIIYAGSLHPPRRTLEPLFQALQIVQQTTSVPWKFHYFGPNSSEAEQELEKWGLSDHAKIHGNTPRKEVLAYQKGAMLNVIITSSAKSLTFEDKGVIPGKVFELIGMKASILPIVIRGSSIEDVLHDVGYPCFEESDQNGIAEFVIENMRGYSIQNSNPEKYSWKELSNEFDQILRNLIAKS